MKRILYLTFYFEPDLCAGSFRNSPLAKTLANKLQNLAEIEVISTLPNRYNTFSIDAPEEEQINNLKINRIAIPTHKSGMIDQVLSFKTFYSKALKISREKKYDLVIASSSRLFTAYLGYSIAKEQGIPLYLDIRDIFYDTLEDILKNNLVKKLVLPVIKKLEKQTFSYASHINLISEGFYDYFSHYSNANYTFIPNGIDDLFIDNFMENSEGLENCSADKSFKTIVYAGNIGEGQGLDKIIPQMAQVLGCGYKIIVIGDGGNKSKLINEIQQNNLQNVEFMPPVKRGELINIYNEADYLFVHLNDYKAFEKVLPSKVFELATFPQPIIAGVSGYAAKFIREKVDNSIIFEPCNIDDFLIQFKNFEYKRVKRTEFVSKYKRNTINESLSSSIVNYL